MKFILLPIAPCKQRLASLAVLACLFFSACGGHVDAVNISAAQPSGVDYSFVIWKEEIPRKIPAGGVTTASVTLINNGRKPWISTQEEPYSLSYHWKHPGGRFTSDMFWGERTPLPSYVGVGEMVTVQLAIQPPERPKYYDLTVDIVRGKGRDRQSVAWFEELGWKTHDLQLEVTAK